MPRPFVRPSRRPRPQSDRARSKADRPTLPFELASLLMIAGIVAWLAVSAAQAALASPAPSAHAAAASRLPAPRQLTPKNAAQVSTIPGFSWRAVRSAAKYEFQLAADPEFKSMVRRGWFKTFNTFASIETALADGDYYWRVRAIDSRDRAGRWSAARSLQKAWPDRPRLREPADGAQVNYPETPLVFRWDPVPHAYKYRIQITTDPEFAHSALGDRSTGIETSGTKFALPHTLAPDRYYWRVTPIDARKHSGQPSDRGWFDWSWASTTTPGVADLNDDPRVFDPQFSWGPIAGAAQYEVEINSSQQFPSGSRVCCKQLASGPSLSPSQLLPNNTFYWRVRAIDADGRAGIWNRGPDFRKAFDDLTPSIPNLHVRDNRDDPVLGGLPVYETGAPVVTWDPVPEASSYEVTVAPWLHGGCDWTANRIGEPKAKVFTTATTAWTPLAEEAKGKPVGTGPPASFDMFWSLEDGVEYCARVRARDDRNPDGQTFSAPTQLGGDGATAFKYKKHRESCVAAATPAGAYLTPREGETVQRMPLFTWDRVPGACGYWIVVARDADFTNVVDVAYTNIPAYAPRTGSAPVTYRDETGSYYWVAMPTTFENGTGLSTMPRQNSPRWFQKNSSTPELYSPLDTTVVNPEFRWRSAEGARTYHLQVADDDSFAHPILDVVTDATSYTTTSALPPDGTLYWRVCARDERNVELPCSAAGRFERSLPAPGGPRSIPDRGEVIPELSWQRVQGAVSYDVLVEEPNGAKRAATTRATSLTPVSHYGTGVWRWRVRANFKEGSRLVSGPYIAPLRAFTRVIATPTRLRKVTSGNQGLLSWTPAFMAKQYKVQVSTSDSFARIIEQAWTDHASWAPKMLNSAFRSGEALYWRVAVVDEGGNVGGYATDTLRAPKPLKIKARGKLRRGRTATVTLTLTSGRKRVSGAVVSAKGPVRKVKARRSGKRGTVRLRVRATKKGVVRFTAAKRGYATASATLRVR
jgi:hypothetical protein